MIPVLIVLIPGAAGNIPERSWHTKQTPGIIPDGSCNAKFTAGTLPAGTCHTPEATEPTSERTVVAPAAAGLCEPATRAASPGFQSWEREAGCGRGGRREGSVVSGFGSSAHTGGGKPLPYFGLIPTRQPLLCGRNWALSEPPPNLSPSPLVQCIGCVVH